MREKLRFFNKLSLIGFTGFVSRAFSAIRFAFKHKDKAVSKLDAPNFVANSL